MAAILNKVGDPVYLRRANTPDFAPADYWINPDVSAVDGITPLRFWDNTANPVVAISGAAQQAILDADAAAVLASTAAVLSQIGAIERATLLMMRKEFNRHGAFEQSVLDAVAGASNLAQFKAAMALLTAVPNRTEAVLKAALVSELEN